MGLRSGVVLLAVGVVLLAASGRAAALGTCAADLAAVACTCLAAGALTLPVQLVVRRLRARRPTVPAVLVDAVPPL